LFSLLGTLYGGDGITTFNVPDLRGRTAVSAGELQKKGKNYNLGDKAGSSFVTLQEKNIPAHTHDGDIDLALGASRRSGTEFEVNNCYPARLLNGYALSREEKDKSTMRPPEYSNITISEVGASVPAPIDTRSPFLVITYIICFSGIFPSRQ
jgi:microcystin-dependent protein